VPHINWIVSVVTACTFICYSQMNLSDDSCRKDNVLFS